MLLNLYIKDFGIIEKTEIIFTPGLNVLSGETGAGKSIIIEALQVVTGGRALSEYVRAGCEKAVVQAAVEAPDSPDLSRLLEEGGISPEEDGTLILAREINRTGRNLCRVNGQMVTLGLYREIGRRLVDIEGQYDQQLLFEPDRQLYLLDAFGGGDLSLAAAVVSELFRELRGTREELGGLRKKHGEWAGRQDLINYQTGEIDGAAITPGEDESLAAERKRLANSERISSLAGECYRDLYGRDGSASALELAGRSLKTLEKLSDLDQSISGARELAASALYQIEEACRELSAYIDGLEFNPERQGFVEERLDLLDRLKKKYGPTLEDVLSYRSNLESESGEMAGHEEKIALLERKVSSLSHKLEEKAGVLTDQRRRAAKLLEGDIARELSSLEMPGAVFRTVFSDHEEITEKGREMAEFFISTNPGEPVRPLSRVASGGETSRVMLAVKIILAGMEGIPTLVFDEIDTGIGGRTIRSVAVKLHQLGRKRQVICVTHSPAVASMADNHLLIIKRESGGRTMTGVMQIGETERLEELARMLGGEGKGGAAFGHAAQLLDEARAIKKG